MDPILDLLAGFQYNKARQSIGDEVHHNRPRADDF